MIGRGAILAALALAVTPAAAKMDSFRTRLIASVPKLAMLAKADPAAFDRIADIYQRGERAGTPTDRLVGQARAAFVGYQQDRLAHAPDALLIRSLDSTIAVAADLMMRSPERCAALFMGANAGDIAPFLSASTRASEDAVFAASLEAPRVTNMPIASASMASAPLARVLAATANRLGTQPTAMIRKLMAEHDATGMCRLQHDVLVETRRDPGAAAIMRFRLNRPSGAAPQ